MTRCECPKEAISQSEHSPGLVQDEEVIVYALVNPLTSSVGQISKSQLKASRLSVCRAGHISGPDARSATVDVLLQKDTTRTHEGFLHTLAGKIRAIRLGQSEVGAFCVIDDALENYCAHAHIGFSEPSDTKLRSEREAARGNLMLLFKERGVSESWIGEPFIAQVG